MTMALDMKMFGVAEWQKKFAEAAIGVDLAARANVTVAAAELVKEAMANFEGAHRKGEPHVGGNKPNVVTGTLRRSIKADPIRRDMTGGYSTTVGPQGAVYSRAIELGRKGHNRPFPYFGPAAASVRARMTGIAVVNWAKYVKL